MSRFHKLTDPNILLECDGNGNPIALKTAANKRLAIANALYDSSDRLVGFINKAGNNQDLSGRESSPIGTVIDYPNSQLLRDAVNQIRLKEIYKRLYSAANGGTLNYIVTGDSTRDLIVANSGNVNPYISYVMMYYRYLLSKINVTIGDNADSGDTAAGWLANTGDVTLTQALALISGTGSNSILEFSFGINDYTNTPVYATIKTTILACIDALLAAKANLAILLVSPVKTSNDVRNKMLEMIYHEVANERDLPLISGYNATKEVHGDSAYYVDVTHPNEFGSRRLINYIMSRILPPSLLDAVKFDAQNNGSSNLAGPIVVGSYWSTTNGVVTADVNWRSLPEISVNGATSLVINHAGNRRDVCCMDAGGTFITRLLIESTIAPGRAVYLPHNTAKVRINIASNGATYDALNDIVTVTSPYMSREDINKNLVMQNTWS